MSARKIPIIPTIVVVAAVATMIALGIWQLGRSEEKAALIAQYEAAIRNTDEVDWPPPADYDEALFRRATLVCGNVAGIDSVSGRSRGGASGWALIARCTHDGAGVADVAIGWSRNPQPPEWQGGEVSGLIAPYGDTVKLVAEEGQAGLEALTLPDPGNLPNNHLAYAGQWFFFALTALLIYGFALRKKWREQG